MSRPNGEWLPEPRTSTHIMPEYPQVPRLHWALQPETPAAWLAPEAMAAQLQELHIRLEAHQARVVALRLQLYWYKMRLAFIFFGGMGLGVLLTWFFQVWA